MSAYPQRVAPPITANAELPLRERKKGLTRQVILDAAEALFEARGYDAVTVAQIANAANVSVKTLFVYFRSKEDLAVADTWLQDTLAAALAEMPSTASPARIVADVLTTAAQPHTVRPDGASGLKSYHRGYGDAVALQGRILRLWADLEDRLTQVMADRADRSATPADRLMALQLVALVRLTTSPEARRTVATPSDLTRLIDLAAEAIDHRLAEDGSDAGDHVTQDGLRGGKI